MEAIRTLGQLRSPEAIKALVEIGQPENALSIDCVRAIGLMLPNGPKADTTSLQALDALKRAIVSAKATAPLKAAALNALAGNRAGTQWLLEAKQKNELPDTLSADAGKLLRNSPFQGERNKAMLLFPAAGKLNLKKLPAPAELAKRTGDATNGAKLMLASLTGEAQCMKCHMVRGQGGQIGPDLSLIGKKGSKENLYDSILNPSKAIADQHASWKIDTEDGQSITGLIVGETETTLTVRDANGKDYSFPVKGTERKKSLVSLMPDNLAAALTEDELIDLVEYMATLQTPSLTPESWTVAGPFKADGNAGLDVAFDPETKDAGVNWKLVRPTSGGYVDLAALHGNAAANSVSYARKEIESPAEQAATILLGTDDGAKLFVNGKLVHTNRDTVAAKPGAHEVKVTLAKGANVILLKVANGNNPHGFYFTVTSALELKGK